MQECGYKTFWG